MATLSVFVTSVSAYACGSLAGNWYDVADFDGDTDAVLEAVGLKAGTDFFLTDYDTDLKVSHDEHADLADLKELLDAIDEECIDEDVANVILDDCCGDACEAAQIIRDHNFSIIEVCADSDECLGEALAEEFCILDGVPENVARYFDYDAYGRDFRLEVRGDFTENRNAFVWLYD